MRLWCRPSFKGAAYIASANFIGRAVILLGNFIHSLFSYKMILLYGAHLDTHILLFFQAVFKVPVFLLGSLIFFGIEKESFNVVLYPTLMLLFLVLLRYGAELALLIIHWDEHKLDRGPSLIYYLIVDLICLGALLLYVYFCLASGPKDLKTIQPTPAHLIEAPPIQHKPKVKKDKKKKKSKKVAVDDEEVHSSEKEHLPLLHPNNTDCSKLSPSKRRKAPAPPPEDGEEIINTPPPRPPPSPKFNYKLRRNIGHLPKDSAESAMVEELDKQKQRNSQILLKEDEEGIEAVVESVVPIQMRQKSQSLKVYETEPKRRSLLIETDLDAEPQEHEHVVQVEREPTPPTTSKQLPEEDKPLEAVEKETGSKDNVEEKAPEEDDSEWEYEYEYEEQEEPEVKSTDAVGVAVEEERGRSRTPTSSPTPGTSSTTTKGPYKSTAV